jgi:tetratricopeptide (TPR) repeat protein
LKIAMTFCTAALVLASAGMARSQTSASPANQPANQSVARMAPAKRGPQAKTKPEFEAYQSAAAQSDPAKLEAAATEFAQRYPASELRPFLFQRAMGLYQQANNPGKTLEMARAELKYDPANPVALLTAAQMLLASTHDSDLDRDARLEEAGADARSALQHAETMAQPDGLTARQFADAVAQLRGAAHEVIASVAYKKREYFDAIREYDAAVAVERDADAAVWLRLAVAHDRVSEYELGFADAEKAIANSKAGSPVRELAEREKARLLELLTAKPPVQKQSGNSPAPGSGEGSHAN